MESWWTDLYLGHASWNSIVLYFLNWEYRIYIYIYILNREPILIYVYHQTKSTLTASSHGWNTCACGFVVKCYPNTRIWDAIHSNLKYLLITLEEGCSSKNDPPLATMRHFRRHVLRSPDDAQEWIEESICQCGCPTGWLASITLYIYLYNIYPI